MIGDGSDAGLPLPRYLGGPTHGARKRQQPRGRNENCGGTCTLITSRLSLVESARAFHRLRQLGQVSELRLADAQREVTSLWSRCELWELTAAVCDLARQVSPGKPLRTLDALHLATFLLARERIEDLELLTVDNRMREAVETV